DLAALLQVEDRVRRRDARAVGHQGAVRARGDRAVPRLPAREDVVHDPGALGVGHALRAGADQTARRNPELQPHPAAAVVDHLGHHALALADLGDDDALVILGDVDDPLFDRLHALSVYLLGDDVGPRDLQLEPL